VALEDNMAHAQERSWLRRTIWALHAERLRCVAKSLRGTRSRVDARRIEVGARGSAILCMPRRRVERIGSSPCPKGLPMPCERLPMLRERLPTPWEGLPMACEERNVDAERASGVWERAAEHPEALSRQWELARCAVQWGAVFPYRVRGRTPWDLEEAVRGRRHDLPAMRRSLAIDGRHQRPRNRPQNHRPPWYRGTPKAGAASSRAGPLRVAARGHRERA
jgi:hypothetical protein